MSDKNQGQGLLTKIKSALQPKQSDCCSVSIEAIDEDAPTAEQPERPSSSGGCCGSSATADPEQMNGS